MMKQEDVSISHTATSYDRNHRHRRVSSTGTKTTTTTTSIHSPALFLKNYRYLSTLHPTATTLDYYKSIHRRLRMSSALSSPARLHSEYDMPTREYVEETEKSNTLLLRTSTTIVTKKKPFFKSKVTYLSVLCGIDMGTRIAIGTIVVRFFF